MDSSCFILEVGVDAGESLAEAGSHETLSSGSQRLGEAREKFSRLEIHMGKRSCSSTDEKKARIQDSQASFCTQT
jgi:hypothetical protein